MKVYNPATGTKQKLEAWSMPQLLPDIAQVMEASGGSPTIQQATRTDWAIRSARNWQVGAQLTLGSLVTTVGIPTMHLFETVMQSVGVDAHKLFNDSLREAGRTLAETIQKLGRESEEVATGAVRSSLGEGIGHAVDNVAVIPVVGWVVQILFGLGKLIGKIVKIQKASQLPAAQSTYPPSSFTAEGDTAVFEKFYFDRIRSFQDWTQIYLPPTLGKFESYHDVFVHTLLEPGCTTDTGRRWQGCSGIRFIGSNPITGAIGNVPGTGWLHQSIEYFKGNVNIDPGMYLPSTRSQAGWLWQGAIKGNTPTAFTIDTELLQASWESYLMDLRIAIAESGSLNDEDRRRILTFYNSGRDERGKLRQIFGWYGTGSPIGTSIKPGHNEWDYYQPVKEAKDLRKKQRQMLDTIAVAYLDNSFPAVNNAISPEFHDLWQRRKRQLLEHPDRCLVDLTNVPDRDYRDALRDAGVGKGICAQLGGGLAAPGPSGPSRTTPGLGQDGMPGDGGGGTSAPGTRPASGTGTVVALSLAVAGLGYAAHKGYLQKIF